LAEEILEVVDEANRVIGRATRREIHEKGLRHRSVHVLVFNPRGDLYLQKRSPTKDQHPDHWDTSAAGHSAPGETPLAAAQRELEEELGLTADLVHVLDCPACPETGWEFVSLFAARTDRSITFNREEISDGGFFSSQQVTRLLADEKEKVTPGFRLLYDRFQRLPHPFLKGRP